MAQYDEKYGLVFEGQGNQNWGLTLHIPEKVPLTTNSIFDTYAHMMAYVNNPTSSAIQGLTLAVVSDTDSTKNGIYYIKTIGTKGEDGNALNNGEVIKLSTTIDSTATADEVKDLLDEAVSALTKSDEEINQAIDDLSSATTEALETLESDLTDAIEAVDEKVDAVSGVVSSITETHKVKNVKEGDSVISLDAEGLLSSTLSFGYNENDKKIELKGINDEVIGEVDASNFIKDGMLDNVELVKGTTATTLVFTFNTDSGKEEIAVDVTDLLNGTELTALENALSGHTSDTTIHVSAEEHTKLTNLYDRNQLDAKFKELTDADGVHTADIAKNAAAVEFISGAVDSVSGVVDTHYAEFTAHTDSANTKFEALSGAVSSLTESNETAHGELDAKIASANTEIARVESEYKAADSAITATVQTLRGEYDEFKTATEEALADLKENKVNSVAAEEGSNIVVNETKTADGISYTIGLQWLDFPVSQGEGEETTE